MKQVYLDGTEPADPKQSKVALHSEYDDWFKEWYPSFPRKVAVEKARQAWRKKCEAGKIVKAMLPGMMATLKWQVTELWIGREAIYIPHPSTYINGERWNDERPKRVGEHWGGGSDGF